MDSSIGLLRYPSAPSSLLTNLKDEAFRSEDNQQCYFPSTTSEMDTMLSNLISSNNGWSNSELMEEFGGKPMKQETGESVSQQNGYSYGGFYQFRIFKKTLLNLKSVSGIAPVSLGLAALKEQIDENENESLEENCDQSRNLVYGNGSCKCYMPSFTGEFWEDSAFNNQKTATEEIMISTSNALGLGSQDTDPCYQNLGLTNHLGLPSPSTKMASMEKFLQIQGSVPCKIRAKRGFATHPRSIAERVRRTKISERIKKLQGLFPQSDKQTSTADMLDLTVEYIKDLQEQVKILGDNKAKCNCSRNQKQ
ncbi:hypothetical protein RIF29_38409 [Crotalaria pallida]|uniref:BHLH domain-containing protein n=1 Tax=Crotalaria pallida TaxID=3830 RepID=A0AAN9HSC3_CROPI